MFIVHLRRSFYSSGTHTLLDSPSLTSDTLIFFRNSACYSSNALIVFLQLSYTLRHCHRISPTLPTFCSSDALIRYGTLYQSYTSDNLILFLRHSSSYFPATLILLLRPLITILHRKPPTLPYSFEALHLRHLQRSHCFPPTLLYTSALSSNFSNTAIILFPRRSHTLRHSISILHLRQSYFIPSTLFIVLPPPLLSYSYDLSLRPLIMILHRKPPTLPYSFEALHLIPPTLSLFSSNSHPLRHCHCIPPTLSSSCSSDAFIRYDTTYMLHLRHSDCIVLTTLHCTPRHSHHPTPTHIGCPECVCF